MIEIQPIPETEATLRELRALGSDLQEKGVRAALRKGSKPIADAMKVNAPDDRRTAGSRLARAVNVTQAKTGAKVATGAGRRHVKLGPGEVGLVIGPNKRVQGRSVKGIALATEFGARAHKIGTANNILKIGRGFIRGVIHHPGIRPRYWMGRGLATSSAQFDQLFYSGLEKWMDKYGR